MNRQKKNFNFPRKLFCWIALRNINDKEKVHVLKKNTHHTRTHTHTHTQRFECGATRPRSRKGYVLLNVGLS